jgi:hypothetical protein
MTKISIYKVDEKVSSNDKWIGSDGDNRYITKNFTPNKIADYFNESGAINIPNAVMFRYDAIYMGQQRDEGTITLQTEAQITYPIEDLTSFVLSKKTLSGKDVRHFLNVLPTTKILLQKSDYIDIFGLFRINNIVEDLVEPDFLIVSVEFISGNGILEKNKDYLISLIDLEKLIQVPKLVKETFDYNGSNIFTLSNTINNILQVIVNTTSLHPVAYEYSLPSTVTVINELYAGDVITVVYNYLEEFFEVPNLQQVTNVGNHTTNDMVIDNLPGEYGDYTITNTLNDLGVFNSFTSPTNTDYQSEYTGYGMSIHEIYSEDSNKSIVAEVGAVTVSNTDTGFYSDLSISPGSLDMSIDSATTALKMDDVEGQVIIQYPNKPSGTYTMATTEDAMPFNPSDYDLDEFTNNNIDYFVTISDIPTYSDFIQDSITNGVIDKAPTENAVYDALQLKQDLLGYVPVNKAGDTMLGDLILNRDPVVALGAATKQYVDNISSGINFHSPVYTATTGNLVANYTNGSSGVGAKLTATTNGAISVDGESPGYLERVLVWKQTDQIENGIYDITVVGDSLNPFELTRSTDSDNSPPGELRYGDYTFVLSGDTNGGRGFICNTVGTIVIGVTDITFVQFNAAQVIIPGYGLEYGGSNEFVINPLETQERITLTTTGTSGQATFIDNTLNIPQYSGNPGTITSITASSPLTGGTITSSGTIGIPAATASVGGYLTAANWTTFNNKENSLNNPVSDGYVLSSTIGGTRTWIPMTAGTSYTFNAPLINTGGIVTIGEATAFVDGYLSKEDWSTFFNKQNTLVSGTNIKTVGGTTLLGSGDVPLILPVREVGITGSISNADNGVVILVTATITITIPSGLAPGFECSFVTAPSCVLTIVSASGVTLINNTGLIMLPQLSFTLKARSSVSNSYIVTGNI